MGKSRAWGAVFVLVSFMLAAAMVPGAASAVGSVTILPAPNVASPQSAAPDGYIRLTASGYVEEEFFLAGTAAKYSRVGTWTSDGLWSATAAAQEPYLTRVLVRRPTSAQKFNGTVLVEWVNVTRGFDADSTFGQQYPMLLREGYAWVGVSAQKVGIDALKTINPTRYAAITSPSGDGFSYDIFSQAGNAVRTQAHILLGGLSPERVLAQGASQSAGRLVTYINAVHPLAMVFDGFLVQLRSAAGAALDIGVSVPSPSLIRSDLDVPVFTINSETDANGYFPARQPDSERFRYWEIAGSAHAPWFRTQYGNAQAGLPLDNNNCTTVQNDMPFHRVLQAATRHLNAWVQAGTLPPSLPKIDIQGSPRAIQRDAYGNALGGIRLPEMNVPIARYAPNGMSNLTGIGALLCSLAGALYTWSNSEELPAPPPGNGLPQPSLRSLYRNHGAYVSDFAKAVRDAVEAGYLLTPDAAASIDRAAQSAVGKD